MRAEMRRGPILVMCDRLVTVTRFIFETYNFKILNFIIVSLILENVKIRSLHMKHSAYRFHNFDIFPS